MFYPLKLFIILAHEKLFSFMKMTQLDKKKAEVWRIIPKAN